jgi:hypothetical protein
MLLAILKEIVWAAPQNNVFLRFIREKSEDISEVMKQVMTLRDNHHDFRLKEAEESSTASYTFSKSDDDTVIHIAITDGDPCQWDMLHAVMAQAKYEQAIVMAPCDKIGSDPLAADSWVVRVMLMLRHFSFDIYGSPIHAVCETALDSTTKLAMANGAREINEDFVNVHAVRARAICQVLAYPKMALVLRDIFSKDPGCSAILMIPPRLFRLGGRKLSFLQASQVVKLLCPSGDGRDVLLGIHMANGALQMPPPLSEEHRYVENDRLVVLTRTTSSADVYSARLQEALDIVRSLREESANGKTLLT